MATKLTKGCIEAIMQGENMENPVVQILYHARATRNTSQDRYWVTISDGIHFTAVMLTTQLNNLITDGEIQANSIICLDQYVRSGILDREIEFDKVLLILKLSILAKGDVVRTKLGAPVNYETIGYNMLPIVALNPSQSRWTIEARVVQKNNILRLPNIRPDARVFSMSLADSSGTIRALAINDVCDKFYDAIELNKVFRISRCRIIPALKEFTTLSHGHDFELLLNLNSLVISCDDDDYSILQMPFKFSTLSTLQDTAADSFVDILGVCTSASDLLNMDYMLLRKRKFIRRKITIVDTSDASIDVILWNTIAENFNPSNNPVIAIKRAKIDEYGTSICATIPPSSRLVINPDISEAHQLRAWYNSLDSNHKFTIISTRIGSAGAGVKLWTLNEVITNQVTSRRKTNFSYHNVEATISFVKSDGVIFRTCPNERRNCKREVIDNENGTYKCEKCNQDFPNFVHTLFLILEICDWSGYYRSVIITEKQAEDLLGATTAEVCKSRDEHNDAKNYHDYFRKPVFKKYLFRLRVIKSTTTSESRVIQMLVADVRPIDYKEACERMIEEIKTLSGVSITNH